MRFISFDDNTLHINRGICARRTTVSGFTENHRGYKYKRTHHRMRHQAMKGRTLEQMRPPRRPLLVAKRQNGSWSFTMVVFLVEEGYDRRRRTRHVPQRKEVGSWTRHRHRPLYQTNISCCLLLLELEYRRRTEH